MAQPDPGPGIPPAAGDGAGPAGAGRAPLLAVPVVQVDTARVRVTEWTFAPGAQTGHHIHAMDYVVVPLTSGRLRLEEPDGVREVRLQAGGSYARPAGVAHNVINANDFEFRFVEIELREVR